MKLIKDNYQSYAKLLLLVSSMRKDLPYSHETFRRRLRVCCKTQAFGNSLYVRLDGNKFGIRIEPQFPDRLIVTCRDSRLSFNVGSSCQKSLILKLLKTKILFPEEYENIDSFRKRANF